MRPLPGPRLKGVEYPVASRACAADFPDVAARWTPGGIAISGMATLAIAATTMGGVVRTWTIPDTPSGLHSNQNWHAVGSTPEGDIIVAGMDHVTNSALFRLRAGSDVLEFIGDARSASEAASNWLPGETAQKFHTRPTWLNGRVYVATLDYSPIDKGYLMRRGFHWYGFASDAARLEDLSASAPGGTALEHGGLATLAADPARGVLWGATIPDARLVRYDPRDNVTTDFGRPPAFGPGFSYTGRFIWVGPDGKVYFTGGNPAWGQKEPPEIFAHVHFFDSMNGEFGERRDWKLAEARAIEMGQWNRDRTRCYLADDTGRVFRFDADGPAWTHLGSLAHDGQWVWVMQLSADERSIYFVNSGAPKDGLYEFDTQSGSSRRLAFLEDLHPDLKGRTRHTGHDAWDSSGRFYFTSFPWPAESDLLLTRVDIAKLKASLDITRDGDRTP
ncbi:MAG TPA: hypothetical protein VMM36_04930 [Opitutaceae bacterium]|nr:hypothetical protein [Opitutaceae bacterium]